MGLKVNNFMSIIMNSMPESYHNPLLAITAVGASLDSKHLIILLLEEDDYQKSEQKRGKSKLEHQMLNISKGKSGKKSDLKCDNCSCKGHTKNHCFQLSSGKEGQALYF